MPAGPIAELLPHAGEMILLDTVIEAQDERIACLRTVRSEGLFEGPDGLPAWAGVELMAQVVAAWAGHLARQAQQPVRLGFLLGTRHYRCDVDGFPPGTELRVEATRSFHDDSGMAVFACRIESAIGCAEASLNVFSPPDAKVFFAASAGEPT